MVKVLGYHDAYASGVVHAIAGGTCLAVLINLGPRIGKFAADGTPRNIPPQNPWLVCIGLFLIYTGFWGFYAACNIPIYDVQAGDGVFFSATNIYLQPTTLSAITFNFIMSLSGGLMAGYLMSKADPFWTFSGGLAGVISAVRRQRSLSSDPGAARRLRRRRASSTSCTTGWSAASRSMMRSGRSRCMAMPASSAWSPRASCSGAIRLRRMRCLRHETPFAVPSRRGVSSSAPSSCSSCSASSRDTSCPGS